MSLDLVGCEFSGAQLFLFLDCEVIPEVIFVGISFAELMLGLALREKFEL